MVSRELPRLARHAGWNAHLWSLSAGYGLVPADALVYPYAATFQPGHVDSVSRLSGAEQVVDHRRWWELLTAQPGPDEQAPRSVADLVRQAPSACVLIVASPAYLLALEADLLRAVPESTDSGGLIIISSSVPRMTPELEQHRVASTARLQSVVGGSLVSLHARVARWVIQTATGHGYQLAAVKNMVAAATNDLHPPTKYQRLRATDEEVRTFLRTRISAEPEISHTRLLHEWRSAGHACEQGRFRELFQEVRVITL